MSHSDCRPEKTVDLSCCRPYSDKWNVVRDWGTGAGRWGSCLPDLSPDFNAKIANGAHNRAVFVALILEGMQERFGE
jgi:hypothetical protein